MRRYADCFHPHFLCRRYVEFNESYFAVLINCWTTTAKRATSLLQVIMRESGSLIWSFFATEPTLNHDKYDFVPDGHVNEARWDLGLEPLGAKLVALDSKHA